MIHSEWFAPLLLLMGLLTLTLLFVILILVLKQYKKDCSLSDKMIESLTLISEQQKYIAERHESMTNILATVSNEFLRWRQKEDPK